MDYIENNIENKTKEELDLIVESIDKYLLINDYENAFIFFNADCTIEFFR